MRERRALICSQKELQGTQGSQQSPSGKLISRRGEVPWNNFSIPTCPPLLGCALWQPQSLAGRLGEGTKAGRAVSSSMQGDCSHSQSRAHPIPCPLQQMAPCCCACWWGHHSLGSDSPYIQNSCNAWKPKFIYRSFSFMSSLHDPPLAPSNIVHTHSDAVFRSWLSEQPDKNNPAVTDC